MQETSFFTGTSHRVILGSPTLQTTSRRICIPIRMPLTGDAPFTGLPDWVGAAYDAVSKYLTEASPEVQQVAGLVLAFSNDVPKGELFAHPSAKVSGAELKNFTVARVGDPDDDPEVELQFKVYAPYIRDFWAWCGELCGKEVYMSFPSNLGTVVVKPPQAKLIEDAPTQAETDALAGDTKPGPGTPEFEKQVAKSLGANKANGQTRLVRSEPPRAKNGPRELAAEHAKQTAKAGKGARVVQ